MLRRPYTIHLSRYLIALVLLLIPAIIVAQSIPNATPNDSFGWSQSAPALTDANGYVYKYYLDGAVTGSVFSGVTCTGTTTPFNCKVKVPTFSNGQHSITLTAANAGGESAQSTPFAFVFGNPPTSPNNISIIRGP